MSLAKLGQLRMEVPDDAELGVDASPDVASMYHLSPYVWRENGRYAMLVRVVNRSEVAAEKVARIHYGRSDDGLHFSIDDEPVIAPGPQPEDRDGCEDPTVYQEGGEYYVYYTGWNETRKEANLLWAVGDDARALTKRGVAIPSTPQVRNPKEATLQYSPSGWRLFFEYSRENRSWIGLARADAVNGPWERLADPFSGTADAWDDGMLSPGPLIALAQRSVMFYNGAPDDDHWKIGWVVFDEELRVLDRSKDPLVEGSRPEPGAREMAFASSAVVCSPTTIWLYYSAGDMQMRRATVALS